MYHKALKIVTGEHANNLKSTLEQCDQYHSMQSVNKRVIILHYVLQERVWLISMR